MDHTKSPNLLKLKINELRDLCLNNHLDSKGTKLQFVDKLVQINIPTPNCLIDRIVQKTENSQRFYTTRSYRKIYCPQV